MKDLAPHDLAQIDEAIRDTEEVILDSSRRLEALRARREEISATRGHAIGLADE
ncbi:hypothetical protein [Amaricoccus solimangrovi]|uniref:hypothetical protein n=1 Tax=Amaricoccus solimangrovi TaxID=2589815 RepID=UPI0015E484A5|nr:hypothetical protein [Amaricoccus solimangrovi]